MKKEEIFWGDWHRFFIGQAPEMFLLEVFIRTAIMFPILLIVLRLMGKRMAGQLTISELAVMLTLGAIISLPMQAPDRGLLQGLLVLVCALAFQRGLSLLGFKNKTAEEILQGKESLLVKDGVMNVREMQRTNISNQQLFGILRGQHIYNLGAVQRLYLEACGVFSLFEYDQHKPGLSLLPIGDETIHDVQPEAPDLVVCQRCGYTADQSVKTSVCSNCENDQWVPAILS